MPSILGRSESGSSGKIERPAGEPTKRSSEFVYFVLADDATQTRDDILEDTPGLPQVGTQLDGGTVVSAEAEESNTVVHPITQAVTILWEVTISTDSSAASDGGGGGGGGHGGNQFDSVKHRWSIQKVDRVLQRDILTGEPIQTKCGEPILAERPVSLPVLEIDRYETYPFDPTRIYTYVNTICNYSFWDSPIGSAYLDEINVEEYEEGAVILTQVKYRIVFDIPDGEPGSPLLPWQLSLLHQGTMHFPVKREEDGSLTPLGGSAVAAVDDSGERIMTNLDAGGWPLNEGADPVFLPFNRYRQADWSPLNIDIEDIVGL